MSPAVYTNTLKDKYVDFLMNEANGCFKSWESAIESNRPKRAAKYLAAWETIDFEINLIDGESCGAVARYIFESRETNPLAAAFCWTLWGYIPEPRYVLQPL